MIVHLNTECRVRMTPWGVERWRTYWGARSRVVIPAEGDAVVLMFWQVMQIFGPDFRRGSMRTPFVGNEIEILLPDDADRTRGPKP